LSLTATNAASSTGKVLKVSNAQASGLNYGIYATDASTTNFSAAIYGYATAATGQVYGVKGESDSTSNAAIGVLGGEYGATGQTVGVQGEVDSTTAGAAGVAGYANGATGATYGVYGDNASTTAGAAGGYFVETGASGATYGVYGSNGSATGYGGYFTNTNGGYALVTGSGTVKLGTAGAAFTSMGVCTVASYTPTNSAATKTCTGVPASTAVAVHCSQSAAFSTITDTISARANGTADQIEVSLSGVNTTAVTLKCMWVQ
jgi:hypothetical protein